MKHKTFLEWMEYIGSIYYAQVQISHEFTDNQINKTINEMNEL